jgi:hypothetical protein
MLEENVYVPFSSLEHLSDYGHEILVDEDPEGMSCS